MIGRERQKWDSLVCDNNKIRSRFSSGVTLIRAMSLLLWHVQFAVLRNIDYIQETVG